MRLDLLDFAVGFAFFALLSSTVMSVRAHLKKKGGPR